MTTLDSASRKVERLKEISKAIVQVCGSGQVPSFKDIVTWIEYNIGLSKTKAEEYIYIVVKAHPTWRIEKEHIYIKEGS